MNEIMEQVDQEMMFDKATWQKNSDLLKCFNLEDFIDRVAGSTDKHFIAREFAFMLKDAQNNLEDYYDSLREMKV